MADYYTLFSFDLKLPNTEAVEYAMNVVSMVDRLASESDESRKSLKSEFPDELLEFLDDWSFEVVKEESAIWIHSDYGGVDAACQFVQHLLDKFRITETITFEWANTCSKPRLDAYGGGAVLITATDIKSMTTSEWIYQQLHRHPFNLALQTGRSLGRSLLMNTYYPV